MRLGPSSLRASRFLAKGLRRPKLRSDLRISRQNVSGTINYVVKIEESNSYRRFGEYEMELLEACDGTRTPAELVATMSERHPDEPVGESEVLEFLDSIESAMWVRSAGERNLAVLERLRDERKSRIDQSSLLYITFRAWDPNRTLAWLDKRLGWMFTRGFVLFSVALYIVTAVLLLANWQSITRDTIELWNFTDKSLFDIFEFWVIIFLISSIHEFGHGLTCKHYGGDVHQMGLMLIYFTPAFFTDTTDLLLFDRVSSRQWVIFAGIWIEAVVCGLSALVWRYSHPGTVFNDFFYKMVLLSGFQGIIVNLNPLIKADGYYALCQHVQIDNLREDAFAFLRAWLLKYVLRRDIDLPPASRRQRRIFLIFSLAAVVYSTALIVIVLWWVKNIFVSKFGAWGYFLYALLLFLFFRKRIRKAWPAARVWLARRKEEFMAWKMTRAQQIGLAGVILLLAVPPVPSKVDSGFVLQPGQEAFVRATVPGEIARVLVRQGQMVEPGQVLAVLENPELTAQAAGLSAQLAMAESRLRSAEQNRDPGQIASAGRESQQLAQDLQVTRTKLAALEFRAPIAGIVPTPDLRDTVGEYFQPGQMFCRISGRSEMRARILVRDWEMDDVTPGARVDLKANAYPLRTYRGRVERILPAAALDQPVSNPKKLERNGQEVTNYFAILLDFPNPDGSLREGMTGTAKIYGKRRPLAWQWGRGFWRWLRSMIW